MRRMMIDDGDVIIRQMQEQIDILNEHIDKMKNCFNCEHSIYNGGVCINPNKRYKDCKDFSAWKLKEKEND